MQSKIIVFLLSLMIALPAWAGDSLPGNYMDGLEEYFYEPRLVEYTKTGEKVWCATNFDGLVRLFIIGNKKAPSRLVLDILPPVYSFYNVKSVGPRNDKIVLTFLYNVAPSLNAPKEWLSEAGRNAWSESWGGKGGVVKEVDGVCITVSYWRKDKIYRFIVVLDGASE